MNDKARFRGGPRDGETLVAKKLPSEVRYVARTTSSDCDWEHAYVLRGTPVTGWYYEHMGYRLVAPPNERVNCPSCDVLLPWPSPPAVAPAENGGGE